MTGLPSPDLQRTAVPAASGRTAPGSGPPRRKRNVAVVFHFFPHYRDATLQKLARSTRNSYCFLADTTDPQRFGIKGSTIESDPEFHRIRTWRIGRVFFHPGLLAWAVGRKVDTFVIASVPYCLSYWILPLLARLRGKRVIFWTIGWIQDERGFKNWLRTTFNSLAHTLLFYGHHGKQLAMDRGFHSDRLHVVYNALDYESQKRFRSAVTPADLVQTRRQLFASPDDPVLVCCSRLQPHRQLGLVVSALEKLRGQGIRMNLLLIGDGPERERLEAQAAAAGVAVHFFGACYDEAILSRLIMSADLTVAPGMVGLTAMQSLAYGTPVLTHDDPYQQAPESESLEPGVTGQFFRYQDVDDLAAKILDWFERGPDREWIRQRCQNIIERFYNPDFQARVIERAVEGLPADDLFWMKEPPAGPAASGAEETAGAELEQTRER